ncbi:MAG: xanthine dehydrogenase family protein molybdopterin-binding subunit [Anaerolineaceae bacterium]|nr:xanthine dehydrogenase family protein molybdopterin-binding subunit [Anaerolineaceae bacterium]
MKTVGKALARVDALSKVTGKAKYPGDFHFSDALVMKTLFAGRPHARILAIDTNEAEAVPGVVMVLTAKDVPVNEHGLNIADQPVLCGPGSAKEGSDVVHFVGDQIALVIAENKAAAKRALGLIKVEWQDLPLVDTLEKALAENAPLLHVNRESNIYHHNIVRHGNAEEAFKLCDVIIERDYETPVQEHAYLQPEAGVGFVDGEGRITIVVGGQWTHEDQEQIAHSLHLPAEKVRVIYPAIGGAFGGREDMSVQISLALAVMHLQKKGIKRPVKTVWSREESIIGHGKRHHYKMHAKWGATRDGRIKAIETQIYADAGAYNFTSTKVLGNATLLASGPYEVENVSVDAYCVYTTNVPGAAFRGFGGPQAIFMAESQAQLLAEALAMDPVEFRMRNLLREGSVQSMGGIIPAGVSMVEVAERCALEAGWIKTEKGWQSPTLEESCLPHIKRGWGYACGYKNIGFSYGYQENCAATIMLYGEKTIERAVLFHAGAEVGQGAHTVFRQFTAEALGLPFEKVDLHLSDTASSRSSGSVSASRMTFMAGNAILGAAKEALARWEKGERPVKVDYTYYADKTTNLDAVDGHCIPSVAYGYVAEAVLAEVNTETGQISLKKVICADDVGKAINPQLVEGQIEGAIVQAAGYTLLENWVQRDGRVLSKEFSTYLIPTVLDIPEQTQSVILEYPEPRGPYGARGMGEMPYLPFAPAVIEAVYHATGKRFYSFPLTDEVVLRGLGKLDE